MLGSDCNAKFMIYQYAKKVLFNSPGLVDFAVRLVDSFAGQLVQGIEVSGKNFEEIQSA